jgi:hypothetical protein
VPGHSVGKQQYMATFVLHDGLACLHELGRKQTGAARHLEEAECEETVDAFAVPRSQVCPFGIAGNRVQRLARERDSVGLNHFRSTCLCLFSSQALSAIAARMSGSATRPA